MIDRINKEIISFLMNGGLPQQDAQQKVKEAEQPSRVYPAIKTSRTEVLSFNQGSSRKEARSDTAVQQRKLKVKPVR